MKKQLIAVVAAALALGSAAAEKNLVDEFREAYDAGNILVADRVFRQMEQRNLKVEPIVVYQAAKVANYFNNSVAFRDRLMYFVKAEANWTPEVEASLWYLCRNGGNAVSAAEFTRLADNVKPAQRARLYDTGVWMLDRLREGKRGAEFVGICEKMFALYGGDKDKRKDLMTRLYNFRRDTRESPGFPHGRADALWMKYPCPGFDGWREWGGWFGENFDWYIRFAEIHAKQDDLFTPGDRFLIIQRLADRVKDAAELKKYDERLLALKGEALRLHQGWQYYLILEEAIKRPANYYPGLEKAALSKAVLADLKAGVPLFDIPSAQNLSSHAANERKILLDEDMWEFMNAMPNGWYVQYYGACVDRACDRAKSFEPMRQLMAKMDPERAHNFAWSYLYSLVRRDRALAIQTIKDQVYLHPLDFDVSRIYSALNDGKVFSNNTERAQILCDVVKLSGCPWRFDEKNAMNPVYIKNQYRWLGEPALKPYLDAVAALQKAGYHPANTFQGLAGDLERFGRGDKNLCDPNAHPVAERFVKLFNGQPFSKTVANLDWKDRALAYRFLNRYTDLCQHNYNSRACYTRIMMPLYGEGSNWRQWRTMWDCWQADDQSVEGGKWCWRGRCHEAKMTKNPALMICGIGPQAKEVPPQCMVDEMTPQQLWEFISTNWRVNEPAKSGFSEPVFVKMVAKLWNNLARDGSVPGWWQTMDWIRPILYRQQDGKYNEEYLKQIAWDDIANRLIEIDGSDLTMILRFINLSELVGKKDEYAMRMAQHLAKVASPVDRAFRTMYMCRDYNGCAMTKPAAELALAKPLADALKAIPTEDAPLFSLEVWGVNVFSEYERVTSQVGGKVRETFNDEVMPEIFRLQQAGMRGLNDRWPNLAAARAYDLAAAKKDAKAMAQAAALAAGWGHWDNNWIRTRIRNARKEEQWQILYILCNYMGDWNIEENLRTEAAKYRAEAATKLPGIYPVGEKDPAYPLYVAADELNRNNSERAWELLKKSVGEFERNALALPPDFTAWGMEQLRMARGKDDALLLKARSIATKLMQNEKRILPQLAAACLYTRAESFRDQQNFEAAKLEYETIRNNNTYASTPYGRKAMFRNVDLMIQMGNQSGAEQTIEYWLSQPDVEIQTQAHYFAAKIAFDRQDYDECVKELKKVFEVDFTHTEARFLHGQWKLATNHEVDETDVQVGSLSDRKIIRPGQQLTITVQDRNLSVAGGGASIPVIVSTEPGGDFEKLQLYPSSRDPTLFRGVLEVRLAPPVVSNLFLEVNGQDTVSYRVDPEFVKARALEATPAKQLTIVDDGALLMGTGAPRTDAADTFGALTKAIESGATALRGSEFSNTLRPGNPVYVAVKDLDRSYGGKDGVISVELGTTSGDRIPDVTLKETKPFSGVFRGEIPTTLPPPRAYASDTAAGCNPGDVINSTRDGVWTSVADSKPGKWFAVDTMGSHVVSNVTIAMRTPQEIKTIRIAGSLSGEMASLGSLPAGKVENRDGLRIQTLRDNFGWRAAAEIRARFAEGAKNRPEARKAEAFAFAGDYREMQWGRKWFVRFTGAFERPADVDYLRLRVKPRKAVNGALRSLRLFAYCDGEEQFNGEGVKLDGATFNVECSKGVHMLEVVAVAAADCDDFELVELDRDGEESPFDLSRFDRTLHPDITQFLEDAAVITRTDKGFRAVFRKPVRLRKIRWEFGDVVSPDVQASAMTMTDTDGKTILPVESDFSDAQKNSTLEVAPGDVVYAKYRDDITANGQKRVLQQNLQSSFNNGGIGFYYETIGANNNRTLFGAHRFRPGDRVIVQVRDSDADVSAGRDKVKVKVVANSGTERTITLVEDEDGRSGEGQCHSGVFTGLLRTQINTDTNNLAKVLLVSPEDILTASYEDRENTSPGVPTERTAKIHAVQPTGHELTLFQLRNRRVVDNSPQAAARLAALKRRPGNEGLTAVYTTRTVANAMTDEEVEAAGDEIPMNIACPIPVRVTCLGRAIHDGSRITVEAAAESELNRAEEDGEEPQVLKVELKISGGIEGAELKRGYMTGAEAWKVGAFAGTIPLELGGGADDDMFASGRGSGKRLAVSGADRIRLRVLGEDGEPVIEKWLKLVSNGTIALMDSTWTAERHLAHVGEKFYITVKDEDRDESSDADEIVVTAKSTIGGYERNVALSETLPHSGVFTGTLRPILFPANEEIPVAVTSRVDDIEELLKEDRFSVRYGDSIVFTYEDENVLPDTDQTIYSVTGTVHKGADGKVRLFSKRFRDNDEAVLVQFRLAECLFEQAKEFRKLKQKEKSAAAIDEGKYLLEEALKNYPDSKHAVQGEYLLANLYQELAAEQMQAVGKDAGAEALAAAKEKARPLYTEALARFSVILSTWPDSEYAPRSQYHKALCLEKLEDFTRSGEEYVKMTYLYPESELVGDATIRLATYYYQREKRYDTAAKIYSSFARRFPHHEKAAKCLFMSGSCFVKQAEEIRKAAEAKLSEETLKNPRYTYKASDRERELYKQAVESFDTMAENFRDTVKPELRAQAMYWAGDASFRRADYPGAYLRLKRCVFEFPETEWARRARGLLLQEAPSFEDLGQ